MRVDRPPPDEEINLGKDETPARQAASAIVLRDGDEGVEVLLVQRNPESRFMGGAWVFPGGAVHDDDDGHAGAAARELEEEAGVSLEPATLVPFSRWITPSEVKTRFDTWFFAARMPGDAIPRCDGAECVDLRWIRPRDALEAGERDELLLVFPTIKHLEQLAEFDSVDEALETARGREVVAVQPKVVVRDGEGHVLLPGDPGFDD